MKSREAEKFNDMESTIGLALSGGGSRAIAFHLGCLRALHDLGILDRVKVLSTVSGGSVIGALYALSDEPFPEFEKKVQGILIRGLVRPTVRTALLTTEWPKALFCYALVCSTNLILFSASCLFRLSSLFVPLKIRDRWQFNSWDAPVRRFASRTTVFRKALDDNLFNNACMNDLNSDKPLLIVNTTDLRTGSAFYFTAKESGSWRLGKLTHTDIRLAQAVTASVAYPLFLPAIDERLVFNQRDGSRRIERVALADGGIYDNLGLAPLWPDRDPSVSLNVIPVDTIICCNAGYSLRQNLPSQLLKARLEATFDCIHKRAQNASMKRLFELKERGKLRNFVLPYLGQDDSKLKFPSDSLVTCEETLDYPTDFSAMSPVWIERLSLRGEQLTKALIAEHAPIL